MAHEQDPVTTRPAAKADAASYPKNVSSEEIRQDIRSTRQEMDQTVDDLQERLRPRHLLDDLLDLFRGSGSSAGSAASGAADTVKDAGSKMLDRLKDNPAPAALIGAGVAWLLFSDSDKGRRSAARRYERASEPPMYSGSYVDARTGEPYDASYGEEYRSGAASPTGQGAAPGQEPGLLEKARAKLGAAAESTRESMGGWASSASESAGGMTDSMREYGAAAGESMRRGYDTGRHSLERGIEEYPLAMGAAALAVGVLAGLLIPATRAEDRWMGEAADDIKDRTKEAGQNIASAAVGAAGEEAQPGELGGKVRRVAEDVMHAASESAHREGLDPQSLKEKAQNVGQRVKDAAKDEEQRQRDQQTR